MTTYRWSGTHAYRDHANDRVIEPGDEIPEDVADQIVDHHPHDVELVEEASSDDTPDGAVDDSADSDDEAVSEDAFDVDEWLDQDYQEREDGVRAGDVDDHLDEIEDVETSSTVEEAIEDRRGELEA